MDDTIYISLAGAREKLIRDTIQLEEDIIDATSSNAQRRLLSQLGAAYIKIGEISQQMNDLDNKPEERKTIWKKLFNR